VLLQCDFLAELGATRHIWRPFIRRKKLFYVVGGCLSIFSCNIYHMFPKLMVIDLFLWITFAAICLHLLILINSTDLHPHAHKNVTDPSS